MIEFNYFLIEQPIGTLYLGALNAKDIYAIAESKTRTAYNQRGIQRHLDLFRIKKISEYAESPDAIFPTAIVLSGASKYIEFSKDGLFLIDDERINNDNNFFSIIDGQHRLEGINEAGRLEDFTLPVVITLDTTLEQDAEIFVTINGNQRPVSKSLIYDLFGLSSKRTVERTCHTIIKSLNKDQDSKIRHKVKMLGYRDENSKSATVSQATMVDSLMRLITNNSARDNKSLNNDYPLAQLDVDKYIFRDYFIREQDEVIYKILKNYFNAWTDVRGIVSEDTGYDLPFMEKSIGYMASFYLLRAVYLKGIIDEKATEEYYRKTIFKIVEFYVAKFAYKFNESGFGYSTSESGAKALFIDMVEAALESGVFNAEFVGRYAKALTLKSWFDEYKAEIASESEQSGSTATTYNDIAIMYASQGKFVEALRLLEKALLVRERVMGLNHPDTAMTYNHIALVYSSLGEYKKALEWNEKALAIRERVLSPGHPDTAMTYSNIASVYSELGEYEKALKWYEKALAIRERVLSPGHPDTAMTYSNIASVYSELGEYEKALKCYERALSISERALDSDHPSTATAYNNVASVYRSLGEYKKALEWHKKALAIVEKVLGADHPSTATMYNNIGLVYDNLGKYEQALEWYEKALAIQEKVLGADHPSTATTYNNIAVVYKNLGDYEKALEWYEKALAIREKVLGADHPSTAATYNNIGLVYDNLGKYEQALEWYEKALAIQEKVLGADHPSTATTYNNIGLVYDNLGKYEQALEWYEKALAIQEKVLGTDHPSTATTYNNIAGVYDSLGDYEKALEWKKKTKSNYQGT
jgi:DGQHR domain-containing protein